MTRPIQASLDLQALKTESVHCPPCRAARARLVGGESERLRARY